MNFSLAFTTAQLVFISALSVVGLIITVFALYVIGTTFWADRWLRKK